MSDMSPKMRGITDMARAGSKFFAELRKLLNSRHIDLLRDFSEACREELSHLPRSAV
jgi:hypothetical protein